MDEFYVKFARSSEGKCSDLVGADYGVSLQELSRPDKCVLRQSASGGRTGSACAARHTPTLNALVGRSGRLSLHRHTPDTTRRSCLCRVGCAGVDWTIDVNVFRLRILCRRQS